ncbi:ATP-binding protein [Roseiconus lacunae]|uniref:ATP-binding protein n=1 Tax=Roseiconus lacunae TaxID=2605694 RepID=UPI0011F0C07D|nr:ATP-binding protein [Roseiconus lacunae]
MTDEGQELDVKSIRYAMDKHKDLDGLASDCVAFANASGGNILLGIEDGESLPPVGQKVPAQLIESIRKRIPQVTLNVHVVPQLVLADNGGEYIDIRIPGNQQSIGATSDGRYYLRVSDETKRLMPDDLGRLLADRNSLVWELSVVRRVPASQVEPEKLADFVRQIRASDRVTPFVKGKTDREILDHYLFVKDGYLTNLGVLWVGRREDRAALLHAPVIQCMKFDENERKVAKWVWDDYSRNPQELIQAVWDEIPDWSYSDEFPAGLFRKNVPHYDEVVVRELLANALVHRPYSQRGDIFINLYPDRLEIHNPGLLPIGVTPRNILHTSSQRNPHLARVFYDLKLMEREGSGYDRMYEVLLASGKKPPIVSEGNDRVVATVRKHIARREIVDFMVKVHQTFFPTQKELITLGLIAQHESLTAMELASLLELKDSVELRPWLGNLRDWGLVRSRGQTKATTYFIEPDVLRRLAFEGATSLKGIEKPRLQALILQDIGIYQEVRIGELHQRIGSEIPRRTIQRELADMVADGRLLAIGDRGARRYRIAPNPAESGEFGAIPET